MWKGPGNVSRFAGHCETSAFTMGDLNNQGRVLSRREMLSALLWLLCCKLAEEAKVELGSQVRDCAVFRWELSLGC